MNTSFGSNVTASNELRSELQRENVLATSETEEATKLIREARMNDLASLVCLPFPVIFHFDDNSAGKFDDNTTFDRWTRADDDRPRGIGSTDAPTGAVDRNMSGEDAYMRRLAMSQSTAPPKVPSPAPVPIDRNMSGEEAYQRRLVLATGGQPSEVATSPVLQSVDDDDLDMDPGNEVVEPSAVLVDRAETGDEAYQRRLAMSQGLRPTAPPFIPSQPLPVPPIVAEPPSPPRLAYNPFAPPANIPPPPPPGQIMSGFEDKVKAAANIAAKLSALAATASTTSAGDSETNSPAPFPPSEEESAPKR